MLYGIIDNKKIKATPNQKAKCPCCGKNLIARCGEINMWHWAHIVEENCDNWYEPETKWHREWKETFGIDYSEVIFVRDGSKHIADIFTREKIVIELQNSPISTETIRARESFYGEKMMWIINRLKFLLNRHAVIIVL